MTLIAGRYQPSGNQKQGGMSFATDCTDIRLDRKVMLKTVKKKGFISRLRDELKSLLAIRSTNVVQVLDRVEFEANGSNFECLVLEFIAGAELVERSYICDRDYISILAQVANGLAEIHAANIIHRDIKPNNIMLDELGVVKIIDFGLSREMNVDNHTASAIGFLPYMAPELLRPPVRFTEKADVYSFGILAMALLKPGLPNFCHGERKYPFPKQAVHDYFAGLNTRLIDCLYACLSSNPVDRPMMSEVLDLLLKEFWKGKRIASVALPSGSTVVSSDNRKATPTIRDAITRKVISSVTIEYDDYDFFIRSIHGDVLANNLPLAIGSIMPDACVLTFPASYPKRIFATWDLSRPELIV